jgi:hypothetical protein
VSLIMANNYIVPCIFYSTMCLVETIDFVPYTKLACTVVIESWYSKESSIACCPHPCRTILP